MSAIQCWPQLLGQPVTWRRTCSWKPGSRASRSSTSQRAKPLVSVSASLQNSLPVQATVPRRNGEASRRSPAAAASRSSWAARAAGTFTTTRFCMVVARSSPEP